MQNSKQFVNHNNTKRAWSWCLGQLVKNNKDSLFCSLRKKPGSVPIYSHTRTIQERFAIHCFSEQCETLTHAGSFALCTQKIFWRFLLVYFWNYPVRITRAWLCYQMSGALRTLQSSSSHTQCLTLLLVFPLSSSSTRMWGWLWCMSQTTAAHGRTCSASYMQFWGLWLWVTCWAGCVNSVRKYWTRFCSRLLPTLNI